MKKYVFFLFILLQACSKETNTAAVSNDFFINHSGKVWVSNLRLIGEYQAVRFEPNQGEETQPLLTYFINRSQRECYTPRIGDNSTTIQAAGGISSCNKTRYEIVLNTTNRLDFQVVYYFSGEDCTTLEVDYTENHSYLISDELMRHSLNRIADNSSTSQAFYRYRESFSSCFN